MHSPEAVTTLEQDLRAIFGSRLQSVVAYGISAQKHARARGGDDDRRRTGGASDDGLAHILVVVSALTVDDLRACSARVPAWHKNGLSTPLMLGAHEFERALDSFPFEFGAILADHVVIAGSSPFDGLAVDPGDLRRACEVHARSHLLHLREGYLETGRDTRALGQLIAESAPALAALVTSVARLAGRPTADPRAAAADVERTLGLTPSALTTIVALVGRDLSPSDAEHLFPAYLGAVERLVAYIDQWR